MRVPVFRKGQWIWYDVPREVPPGWKSQHTFQAAAVYGTAHSLGYSQKESAALAEMYVFKQLFEGVLYDASFETKLLQILNHEEITSDPTKSEKIETYEERSQQE